MVNFKKLSTQAKNLVDKRGGTDALKQDAEQLKEIAKGKGSFSDKAKAAAAALKDPGAAASSAGAATAGRPPLRRRVSPRRSAPLRRSRAKPEASTAAGAGTVAVARRAKAVAGTASAGVTATPRSNLVHQSP